MVLWHLFKTPFGSFILKSVYMVNMIAFSATARSSEKQALMSELKL